MVFAIPTRTFRFQLDTLSVFSFSDMLGVFSLSDTLGVISLRHARCPLTHALTRSVSSHCVTLGGLLLPFSDMLGVFSLSLTRSVSSHCDTLGVLLLSFSLNLAHLALLTLAHLVSLSPDRQTSTVAQLRVCLVTLLC
jgi:hypothetical protein